MRKIFFIFILFVTNFAHASLENLNHQDKVKFIFQNLSKDKLDLIDEFYDKNVEFIDPVGKISGSKNIKKYYENMYQNVKIIRFDFSKIYEHEKTVIAIWSMYLETDKLNGGEGYTVDGNSVITFNDSGKATYHRDYFDMGDFIYERIPVIKFFVKKIKSNLEFNPEK